LPPSQLILNHQLKTLPHTTMMFISALTAAALALICTPLTTASPIVAERQTAQGNFALAIGGGRFDPN
jgi:hypothetical protein